MIPTFRVWFTKEKRMFYSDVNLTHWDFEGDDKWSATIWDTKTEMQKVSHKDREPLHRFVVDEKNAILMQSMGRRGENNKKIFSGDFVRITSAGYDTSLVYLVVRDELGFFLQGTNHTTKRFGDMKITPSMRFVVIGNIHENISMLKDYWRQVKEHDTKT